MPSLKQENQRTKRDLRSEHNRVGKRIKAKARQQAAIELGKTVIVTEVDGVKKYAFPLRQRIEEQPSQSRSTFVSAKKYRQADPRKGRSGRKPEHTQALAEDASRTFANEVTKALVVPAVEGAPIA